MAKPEILVSTDAVGILGNPNRIQDIYPFMTDEQDKLAIELLAWRYLMMNPGIINQETLSVIGIHGPGGSSKHVPGTIEQCKTILMNWWLGSLKSVVEKRGELFDPSRNNYLLVHEPELRNPQSIALLQDVQDHILVENVPYPNSIKETVDKIALLQEQGLSTGVMVDLVHLIKEITNSIATLQDLDQNIFDQAWKESMAQTHKAISQLPASGIHIPIGENGDSIPLKLMGNHHWQDLAQLIEDLGEKIQWLVFENQQPQFLVTPNSQMSALAERNKKIIGQIKENNVF